MLMSRMVTEVETHVDEHGEAIDPTVRSELEVELAELKRHIEDGDIEFRDMQGIVYSIQDIVGDDNLTTEEAQDLIDELKTINEIGATGEF